MIIWTAALVEAWLLTQAAIYLCMGFIEDTCEDWDAEPAD